MSTFIKPATVAIVVATCLFSVNGTAETAPYNEVLFSCDRKAPVSVRFYPGQEPAVLILEEQHIDLQQEPSASGFFYTNYRYSIRGKGDQLSLEIGRMAPIQCLAQQTAKVDQ